MDGFGPIAVSWVVSPVISGVLALAMFTITKYLVLQDNAVSRRIAPSSFWRAVYLAPFFYSFVSAMCVGAKRPGRPGVGRYMMSCPRLVVAASPCIPQPPAIPHPRRLCLLLIYKGTASSANANLAANAANDKFVLGLTTGLVALFVLLLAVVYVSYWQVRTTW